MDLGHARPETFHLGAEYPTRTESRRLAWRNLLFPVYNWRFGFLSAGAYVLLASTLPVPSDTTNVAIMLDEAFRALVMVPLRMVVCVAVLAGFVLFTDTHSRGYRIAAGLFHGLLHLAAALAIAWGVGLAVHAWLPAVGDTVQQLVRLAGTATGGYLAGAILFGLYLLISVNGFGRHGNEAFSALRIADYKNFLRLHVDAEGRLTVYPVKLTRVPPWRDGDSYAASLAPELIEPPFRVGEPATAAVSSERGH